ncbi:hypothetical protein GCM10023079_02860 [Streptomyces chitinivorans]
MVAFRAGGVLTITVTGVPSLVGGCCLPAGALCRLDADSELALQAAELDLGAVDSRGRTRVTADCATDSLRTLDFGTDHFRAHGYVTARLLWAVPWVERQRVKPMKDRVDAGEWAWEPGSRTRACGAS